MPLRRVPCSVTDKGSVILRGSRLKLASCELVLFEKNAKEFGGFQDSVEKLMRLSSTRGTVMDAVTVTC